MLRTKFPYDRRVFRWISALMLAITLPSCIFFWMAVPEEELAIRVSFTTFMLGIAFLFGITPWFTAHEVHDSHIVLRQGWYYRNRIELTDIVAVNHVKDGPWSYGVHFIDGSTVYVNGRIQDLLLLELRETRGRDGKRRRMTRVLFDTVDNEGFLKAIGRTYRSEMDRWS